ncbi:MAG: hydantoinase/oxoprolinase family protein [Candidatus Tectomicrobia bacterium]|nr:hydantoinase/oxoprolinase family protein [Candidatus Tectomicrobia bacterium]
MGYAVGIDIGGTFTDLVMYGDTNRLLITGKVLTTPENPALGALEGLRRLMERAGIGGREIEVVVHGTTLVANAIVERKGATTGLLTTNGFRDIIETRREKRYDLYDLSAQFPEPLVPRSRRLGVPERIAADGAILQPLDSQAAGAAVDTLLARGVESVAICLLHAYRNPTHEQALRDLLAARAAHLTVSLSSEVDPELREYERFSTTVCNAYTQPVMARYLRELQEGLWAAGVRAPLHIMLSSGGITTPAVAARFPVRILESGPVGGVLAAAHVGRSAGSSSLLSFDMGGTTAKLSFIEGSTPTLLTEFEVDRAYRFKKGSGLVVRVPVVDIVEIGAGGGSIAQVGGMGLLKVGPESAGSRPGPACYGFGGVLPTVTDADLLLGYINPERFLGGRMPLNRAAAHQAIETRLGKPLGMEAIEAAWGIHRVVNENMVNAARIYMAEKGRDPKRYDLIAFGGAGPIHAAWLARKLGIARVTVPPRAGVASALGFLVTPLSFDFVRTYVTGIAGVDWSHLNQLYATMEAEARGMLGAAGIAERDITLRRYAEMRYVGQGREIFVPLPAGPYGPAAQPALTQAFDAAYAGIYTQTNPGQAIEAINWRLLASGPTPRRALISPLLPADAARKPGAARPVDYRKVYLGEGMGGEGVGFCECAVYDRATLPAGARISGPALVEEEDTVTLLGPETKAEIDAFSNIVITIHTHAR